MDVTNGGSQRWGCRPPKHLSTKGKATKSTLTEKDDSVNTATISVVVAGEEFRHEKSILCTASPYFKAMLSSKTTEFRENTVYFPDVDPEEWRFVYDNFLDPSVTDVHKTRVLKKLSADDDSTSNNTQWQTVFAWFDYLCLESHVYPPPG